MTTTATPSPAQLAGSIEASWADYLTRARRPASPHPYVYASGYRVCDRRMVLDMTKPEELPPFPAEVLAKFRRGDDRERDLLADLARIGRDAEPPFKVVGEQQRFELRDRKGRTAIVGKVDAQLDIAGATTAPLEVKAWSPQIVDRIETFSDLFEGTWTRSGAYQLLAYLYGANQPFGFILLDRSGLPHLLPVELDAHLDRMEDFLTRAEVALDHQRAGTLPDFLVGDAAECQRCPFFGGTCNPPLTSAGAVVLTDPELEASLERREELKAAGKEYDALDKLLKKQLRGIEHGIAGPFVIEGTWGRQSSLDLPADVEKDLKAKYATVDPKGRFTLKITRLGDAKPLEGAV